MPDQPTLVDTGEKTLVDTLGSQLLTQLPDGVVSADADTYTRLGELLGVALTTTNTRGGVSLFLFANGTGAVTRGVPPTALFRSIPPPRA